MTLNRHKEGRTLKLHSSELFTAPVLTFTSSSAANDSISHAHISSSYSPSPSASQLAISTPESLTRCGNLASCINCNVAICKLFRYGVSFSYGYKTLSFIYHFSIYPLYIYIFILGYIVSIYVIFGISHLFIFIIFLCTYETPLII